MRKSRPVLLIIDSCREQARRLGVALALVLDCEMCFAADKDEALSLAARKKPRAALIDIGPDLDGIEIASCILLRMQGHSPALIAMADEADLLRVAQSGVFVHALGKPVEKQRAAALLRSL